MCRSKHNLDFEIQMKVINRTLQLLQKMEVLYFCVVYYLLLVVTGTVKTIEIDPKKIEVEGPGLDPVNIVMPARYFYVHVRDKNDSWILNTEKNLITVGINGKSASGRDCRIWVNTLNRKDGSYIVRYKVYETCYDMEINIAYNNAHAGASPYKIKGPVQPDDCYCPEESIENWLDMYGCNKRTYNQIQEDLKPFHTVNFKKFHKAVVQKFSHSASMSLCNYIIVKNQVYRRCYGQHIGFKMFVDAILLSLTRKVHLPDMELFVNLGDWPLMRKNEKEIYPIFSWCGSQDSMDIVMPTYELTESSLECMGRVSLDMLSVQGNIDLPWQEKIPKAFWRGRDSSRERLKLVDIARSHPDLFNVSLTNFFFFRDEEEKYGPKEKHISFFKFFDYKYQINLDGTVAAYRFPYLLAGDSLVFKQESMYYEFFYNDVKPWIHYVPFKQDLSDLVDQIQWAIQHEDEAQKIVQRARQYAKNNLLPQHIFCYHAVLFNEWSKRTVSPVRVRKNMEHVPQQDNKHSCTCDKDVNVNSRDEL